MDDRAAYFHTLVPTPRRPVKTSPSRLPARERAASTPSRAVPPSRYPYVKTHVAARRNAHGGRSAGAPGGRVAPPCTGAPPATD
jgi:hypothetical protein